MYAASRPCVINADHMHNADFLAIIGTRMFEAPDDCLQSSRTILLETPTAISNVVLPFTLQRVLDKTKESHFLGHILLFRQS